MSYDEYDDDYDVYGRSAEDECISPTGKSFDSTLFTTRKLKFQCFPDASQWIYDRARGQSSLTEFQANHTDIQEEDETGMEDEEISRHERRDSENYQLPELDEETKAKLLSCMDAIRGIIGDATVSDRILVDTITRFDYDCDKALDDILNNPATASPGTPKRGTTKRQSDDTTIEKGKNDYCLAAASN